jgi:serine/threonine protein kinase
MFLDAQSLIKGLLTRNPKTRLTVSQALSHPWLAKVEKQRKCSLIIRYIVNIFNDGEKSVIQKEFTYKEDFNEEQLQSFNA